MQILPKKRERWAAQIAIVQKEQNFILVSLILEDKIREVKELFWSHAVQKLRAELVISIQLLFQLEEGGGQGYAQ